MREAQCCVGGDTEPPSWSCAAAPVASQGGHRCLRHHCLPVTLDIEAVRIGGALRLCLPVLAAVPIVMMPSTLARSIGGEPLECNEPGLRFRRLKALIVLVVQAAVFSSSSAMDLHKKLVTCRNPCRGPSFSLSKHVFFSLQMPPRCRQLIVWLLHGLNFRLSCGPKTLARERAAEVQILTAN